MSTMIPLATSASGTQLRPQMLAGPEREPVKFSVNLVGAPPEVEQLVAQIKTVAEQFLYHWKTFPIGKCRRLFDIICYFSLIFF